MLPENKLNNQIYTTHLLKYRKLKKDQLELVFPTSVNFVTIQLLLLFWDDWRILHGFQIKPSLYKDNELHQESELKTYFLP